jgi:hypothetical protein
MVTEEILDKAEQRNLKMIEYLQGEAKTGFEKAVIKMISSYKQHEVLRYVVEAIMEENEEAPVIRDEYKGILMMDLKTVIDCFDA